MTFSLCILNHDHREIHFIFTAYDRFFFEVQMTQPIHTYAKSQQLPLKVGDPAPLFTLYTQEGKLFNLSTRKGAWTILYFYPKANTPSCVKQACGFRDSTEQIRTLNAEVYAISGDRQDKLVHFYQKQRLNFTLLSDPELKVIRQYGVKMSMIGMAKRKTFIINPQLIIHWIEQNVDPIQDSKKMIEKLKYFQHSNKDPLVNTP